MERILFSNDEETADVLEEKIAVLRYLASCYDDMCRTGLSLGFYNRLMKWHAGLASLKPYDKEAMEEFESDFYNAVKARNLYREDDCSDLVSMAEGILTKKCVEDLLESVRQRCKHMLKMDPVELTERYLAVIDDVEKRIDANSTVGICHEYWWLKAKYLGELGIEWHSPAVLNPECMFD